MFQALDNMAEKQPDNPPKPNDNPDPKPAPAKEPKAAPTKEPAPAKNPAPPKTAPAKAAPVKAPAPAKETKAADTELPEDLTAVSPKQLRDAYSNLKTQLKNLQKEIQEARTSPKPADDHPDVVELKKAAEGYKKRLSELEDHIRYVDYSKSEEYQKQYHEPYVNVSKSATAEVVELRIPQADGTHRQATAEDFWSIVQIPNAEEALEAAEKLFGSPTKANFVMSQRLRVREAFARAEQAKEDYKTKGAEREKTTRAQREQQQREATARWKANNEKFTTEQADLFGPEEGDDEGNALLVKGYERADAAFGGWITDTDSGEKRAPTPEESIEINSELRTKAGAFDRLAHRNKKLTARIAELEEQVRQYEQSGPGNGQPGGQAAVVEEDNMEAQIDRAARGNK